MVAEGGGSKTGEKALGTIRSAWAEGEGAAEGGREAKGKGAGAGAGSYWYRRRAERRRCS